MGKKTKALESILKTTSEEGLTLLTKQCDYPDFTNELKRLLCEKNVTKSEVIKASTLDRNYAYQIFQGIKQGSKDKIVQICLALKCNLDDTNRLLTLSNNPKLYARRKRDMLLIYALEKQYSVMQANELLYNNKELELQ